MYEATDGAAARCSRQPILGRNASARLQKKGFAEATIINDNIAIIITIIIIIINNTIIITITITITITFITTTVIITISILLLLLLLLLIIIIITRGVSGDVRDAGALGLFRKFRSFRILGREIRGLPFVQEKAI